jgi:hypothetical protein
MKNLIKTLAFIAILAFSAESNAQAVVGWPTGTMSIASVTATTKVTGYTITPIQVAYDINVTVDTSLAITLAPTTYKMKAGAIVYVKVTNNATAATHVVTCASGCTMKSFTLTSAKVHLFTFVYDGTNYLNTAGQLIN